MNDSTEPADSNTGSALVTTANAVAVADPAAPELRAAFTRSKGLPFNGAQIAKVTAELSDAQRVAVRWLFSHGMDKGDDLKRLARRIGKNDNTLYRVFKGEYAAKLDSIVEAIETYRHLAEERDKVGRPPFISTSISTRIWDRCHDALTLQKVATIIGDWQIGKSFAVEAYTEAHNHGQTRLVRMPSGSGFRTFLEYFARACYSATRCSMMDLREGILASLDSRHLVIFDEIDEPLAGRFSTGALQIYAFIREVYDRRKCGIVLCGNRNFKAALGDSGPFGPWMAKLRRRCLPVLDLEPTLTDDDLWSLAAHFGLGEPSNAEARDTARRLVEKEGVGEYVTILQLAKKISITLGKDIHWDHFLKGSEDIDVTAAAAKKGAR